MDSVADELASLDSTGIGCWCWCSSVSASTAKRWLRWQIGKCWILGRYPDRGGIRDRASCCVYTTTLCRERRLMGMCEVRGETRWALNNLSPSKNYCWLAVAAIPQSHTPRHPRVPCQLTAYRIHRRRAKASAAHLYLGLGALGPWLTDPSSTIAPLWAAFYAVVPAALLAFLGGLRWNFHQVLLGYLTWGSLLCGTCTYQSEIICRIAYACAST